MTKLQSKSEQLIVRQMTSFDIDDVYQIELDAYTFAWSKNGFYESLLNKKNNFVLEFQQEIVGFAIIYTVLDETQLLNIAIKQQYKSQGFGFRLLYDIIQNIKADVKTMYLEVRKSNMSAQKLYLKLGFVEHGVRRDYYPAVFGREDAMLYKCDLNKIE